MPLLLRNKLSSRLFMTMFTLYLTSVVWPNMVSTQVMAILWGSHSKAHESEHSSWEKIHIVSMDIGSVGNSTFSHVFNTICWVIAKNAKKFSKTMLRGFSMEQQTPIKQNCITCLKIYILLKPRVSEALLFVL